MMTNTLPAVTNVHWVLLDDKGELQMEKGLGGYPYLWVDFADGTRGEIDHELKVLRMGYNAVFLGSHFEGRTAWTIPADSGDGRPDPMTLNGFTDDRGIVVLAKNFMAALDEGTFRPQVLNRDGTTATLPNDGDSMSDQSIAPALGKLRELLTRMRSSEIWTAIVEPRDQVFARFQPIFAASHLPQLQAEEFKPFLYFEHNQHWTGLHPK